MEMVRELNKLKNIIRFEGIYDKKEIGGNAMYLQAIKKTSSLLISEPNSVYGALFRFCSEAVECKRWNI